VPLAETAASVTRAVEQLARLRGQQATLVELLGEHLRDRFGIRFDPAVWADKPPPEHLRVRVRVVDDRGQELCASRELAEIRAALATCTRDVSAVAAQEEPAMWRRARARWEKPESADWTFGDLPARVEVGDQAGVPVYAYPGLQAGPDGAAVRLYRTPEEADAATAGGLARLIEQQLSRDLGWLERDLRALRQLGTLTVPVAPLEQLQDDAFATLRRWLCDRAVAPLAEKQFADVVGHGAGRSTRARAAAGGIAPGDPGVAAGAADACRALLRPRARGRRPGAPGFPAHDALSAARAFSALPEGDEATRRSLAEAPGQRRRTGESSCAVCGEGGETQPSGPALLAGGGVSRERLCAGAGHGGNGFRRETGAGAGGRSDPNANFRTQWHWSVVGRTRLP
jgi:hypothetical protein